jgi:hypothetical protein
MGCLLSLVTVSFAVQKLFSLMQLHLFIVSLRCWDFWVLLRKLFPIPLCSSVFPTASWGCFEVLGLILRSLIHFQLILVRMKDRDLVSVFYRWISSFPSSICWRDCLFSSMCFGLLCQISVGYKYVGLGLDLLSWSISLPVCFCANNMLFLLLWLCGIIWNRVLWCLRYWTLCSELLWLFEVFCVSICISRLLFAKWSSDTACGHLPKGM